GWRSRPPAPRAARTSGRTAWPPPPAPVGPRPSLRARSHPRAGLRSGRASVPLAFPGGDRGLLRKQEAQLVHSLQQATAREGVDLERDARVPEGERALLEIDAHAHPG